MFQQFAQHQRSFAWSTRIGQYCIVFNTYGATIVDTSTMRELHIFNILVFFPGTEGRDQAAQYIQEYGTLQG